MARLIDITGKVISGEWGNPDKTGDGIPVLRTTNFTNEGIINFNGVVKREIKKKSLDEKYLQQGDIIIEKSGGSDKQPVGRVVFFDGAETTYLFNNFTGVLRVKDKQSWLPKYVFYALFCNYLQGGTKPFENKTTGLHNLKTDQYINEFEIKEKPFKEQEKAVLVLDVVNHIISLRKQQLAKLDELIRSQFIEMFKGGQYPVVKASEVCDFITKGTTPSSSEIYTEPREDSIPYLKVYNLSFDGSLLFFDEPQYISREIHEGKLARSKVFPNDVLMNIVGPPLGKFSLVTDDFPEWNINQAIAIFRAKGQILPKFLLHALMQPDVLQPFLDKAQGVRQLNFSLEQCRNLTFPLPDLKGQEAFCRFVEQSDKSKAVVQQSLDKLETLKNALMQEYFG